MPKYLLNQGDLNQLSDQRRFLSMRGFDVEQVDVFSAVATKEEYVNAIKAIYESRINGWWNYRDELIENGICTLEQYKENLKKSVERRAVRGCITFLTVSMKTN